MEITAKPGLRLGAGHFGLMFRVLNRTRFGRIRVILPDGSEHDFIGDEPGPQAEIEFRNRRVLRRMLTNGSNGFAEGYLAGDFETPDLAALLELGARNEDAWGNFLTRTTMLAGLHRLMHVLRPNSKRGARRNISHHYDLGNRFYSAWLDRSLTYSSAVFDGADQPLEAAQTNKYANIAALGGLKPGDHVLEIGCGWGGFALYAAKSLGCRVTGLTISQEQFEHVRARIAAEGLQDRVEVRFQDYRDTQGVFDRVVSIEMFEAVGERYWDPFFSKLNEVLRPGGTAALPPGWPTGATASTTPEPWPCGTSASARPGRRSAGSALTSVSSACGATTWPIARPGSALGGSTYCRWPCAGPDHAGGEDEGDDAWSARRLSRCYA